MKQISRRGREDPDNAANEYAEAIRLNPGFSDAYNTLGIVLAEQGKHEEAV
jgi:Tfp pilus assembly protein PilF